MLHIKNNRPPAIFLPFLFFIHTNVIATNEFSENQTKSLGGLLQILKSCTNESRQSVYEKLCLNGKETGIEDNTLKIAGKHSIQNNEIFIIEGTGGNSAQTSLSIIKISPNGKWVVSDETIYLGSGSSGNIFPYKLDSTKEGLRFIIKDTEEKKTKIYLYDGNSLSQQIETIKLQKSVSGCSTLKAAIENRKTKSQLPPGVTITQSYDIGNSKKRDDYICTTIPWGTTIELYNPKPSNGFVTIRLNNKIFWISEKDISK